MTKITETFEIVNKLGFHARPAALFAQSAGKFQSDVQVKNLTSGNTADGKSVLSLMILAAPAGTKIEVAVSGSDADAVMKELSALIKGGFDEL